ncbi:MAG: cell wall hydrolase [Erythrobacter sp.]|uniref:cell wall hydrolase n=1 Tax=Erythrobacter sp. TaxID=1042 RepID=UPI0025E20AB8|nr:cell wall hydrolase [Erythrobacter sp.]MCL9999362.1 cell wall hydrolase [Erythrobacter sp.]
MVTAATALSLPSPPQRAPRRGGVLGIRLAGAAGVLALLLVPVLPAPQGQSGSAFAGIAALVPGAPSPFERQPEGSAQDLAVGPPAPFIASYGDAASALRAETCLTEAIYYEGALEPEAGQRAIAQVVLNRVRHPAYPDNVCGVVFQGQERSTGCQFTFTCDGSRARAPMPDLWARANRVAKAALGGAVSPEVGLATHYHADYVMPYWSSTLDKAGQIGRHIFYRWRGTNGTPGAFKQGYTGREPLIAAWTPRALPAGAQDTALPGLGVPTDGAALAGSVAVPAAPLPLPPAPPAPFRARPLPMATKASGGTP